MPESYERFSSPARSAVAAAQDEAASLRHPRIHTEHLLLSLCADAVTVGMTLLRGKQTITPEAIRLAVIRHVGVGPDAVAGHLPWTPRAKRVLQLAVRESTELGDFYVGPEHCSWVSSGRTKAWRHLCSRRSAGTWPVCECG